MFSSRRFFRAVLEGRFNRLHKSVGPTGAIAFRVARVCSKWTESRMMNARIGQQRQTRFPVSPETSAPATQGSAATCLSLVHEQWNVPLINRPASEGTRPQEIFTLLANKQHWTVQFYAIMRQSGMHRFARCTRRRK